MYNTSHSNLYASHNKGRLGVITFDPYVCVCMNKKAAQKPPPPKKNGRTRRLIAERDSTKQAADGSRGISCAKPRWRFIYSGLAVRYRELHSREVSPGRDCVLWRTVEETSADWVSPVSGGKSKVLVIVSTLPPKGGTGGASAPSWTQGTAGREFSFSSAHRFHCNLARLSPTAISSIAFAPLNSDCWKSPALGSRNYIPLM